LAGKLAKIARIEGIDVSAEALRTIARLANGGVRDAESILDRMGTFCDGQITVDAINAAYGLAGDEIIEAIVSAMYYGNYKKLMVLSREIAAKNCDMYRVLCDVEVKIHEQLANVLEGDGNYPDRMVRILSEIHGAKESVKSGISEIVNFETALFRAAEKGQSRAIDAIIRDIRELKAAAAGTHSRDVQDEPSQLGDEESRLPGTVRAMLNDGFCAQISILKSDE
jgi:DNA polymerase-3 subunit gamma/tau